MHFTEENPYFPKPKKANKDLVMSLSNRKSLAWKKVCQQQRLIKFVALGTALYQSFGEHFPATTKQAGVR